MEADAAARADTAYVLAEAGALVAVRAAALGGLGGEPVRGRAGRATRTRAGPAVSALSAHRCLGGGGDGGCPFGLRPWALPPRSELPGEPPRPAPCPGRGSAGFLIGVFLSLSATGYLPCSARLLTAWFMTPVTVTAQASGSCARRATQRVHSPDPPVLVLGWNSPGAWVTSGSARAGRGTVLPGPRPGWTTRHRCERG